MRRVFFKLAGLAVKIVDLIFRREVPFPPRRIFFIRTHAIGDVMLTTAAVRAVKLAWPDTRVTMIVGERSRRVLEGNPYIDSLESFPEEWWFRKQYWKILKLTLHLRRKPKDVLVILHASPLIHLWGALLDAPIRTGFDENGSGFALTHPVTRKEEDYNRYLGDVNLDLVRVLGISSADCLPDYFPGRSELEGARRFLPDPERKSGRPLIGLAPGGGRNAFEKISVKHWPAAHYAQLMIELSREREIDFLLLGDKNDGKIDEIIALADGRAGFVNLKGKTDFRELGAVINHLDLLVTNDSSPLHLAVAMKKPVVALFGPTANWALFPPGANRTALQSPAKCSPCYTYGRFPGCPAPFCMTELSVEAVKETVLSLCRSLRI